MDSNAKAYQAAPMPPELITELKKLQAYVGKARGTCDVAPIIERIHAVSDQFMATRVDPFLTCKRGCSWCCHNSVDVFALEALYIEAKTGHSARSGRHEVDRHSPCPFLRDSECSIYPYRPMVCRQYGSFEDPEVCVDRYASHALYCVKSSDFWFKGILGWIGFNSQNIGDPAHRLEMGKDIREWFPI